MDTYHIQISVYVKADTLTGAKALAQTCKSNIEFCARNTDKLDEVIIHSVERDDAPGYLPSLVNPPKDIVSRLASKMPELFNQDDGAGEPVWLPPHWRKK